MQILLVLQKKNFIFVKNYADEGKIARFDEKRRIEAEPACRAARDQSRRNIPHSRRTQQTGLRFAAKDPQEVSRINPDWLLLDSDKSIGMNIRQPRRASRPPVQRRHKGRPRIGQRPFTPTLPGGLRADEKQTQDADGHDGSATQFPPALFGKANIKRVVVLYDDQTFESFTPSTKR